jgi:hypothetical protein
MARKPMPKALSPLQSDQRSYISEFSVVRVAAELKNWELLEFGVVFREEGVVGVGIQGKEEEGNLEFAGYQGCSGYDGCGVVVIYSVSWKTESPERLSCN